MALLEILKAYVSRESSLELEFKNDSGLDVKVNARNIDSDEIQDILAQLQNGDS